MANEIDKAIQKGASAPTPENGELSDQEAENVAGGRETAVTEPPEPTLSNTSS